MLHHVTISDRPRTWHEKLPYMLWAYRETPHETIGISPYQLVFGKVARGPLSALRDSWLKTEKDQTLPKLDKTGLEYLEILKQNLQIARDIASKYSDKNQSR